MDLIQGQNTKLKSRFFEVEVTSADDTEINLCAILIHKEEAIPSSNEIIQMNWCNYPDVVEFESERIFTLDLDNIDTSSIGRVLLCVDLSLENDRRAGQVGSLGVVLHDREKISFQFNTKDKNERAVILAEIYPHKGEWKTRALGSGFMEGMSALLKSYNAAHLHNEYVTRSRPAVAHQGKSQAPSADRIKPRIFSGFNHESSIVIRNNDAKRFEWGNHQELNVIEVCGMLNKSKVEDSYFSFAMSVHLGVIVELLNGDIVKLDHQSPASDALDDFIWLFPENNPVVTTHTLVVTKESAQVAKRLRVYAYIESDIPYWKRAKPSFFIKPNPNQTIDVTPDYYDMTRFAALLADIVPGQNGSEITAIKGYEDYPGEITLNN